MLSGVVVKGNSLGKTINFPTANLHIEEKYKLIPKKGVYIVKSIIKDQLYFGMMNIGKNPTIKGKKKSIEIHFFDFDQDIYGSALKIEMIKRIRSEEKFDSVKDLKKQLETEKFFLLITSNKSHSREGGNPSRSPEMLTFLETWMGPCLRRDDFLKRKMRGQDLEDTIIACKNFSSPHPKPHPNHA